MIPVVALVGRPNVGKSTLFNALTLTRDALVADRPGVTRDRHYGVCRQLDRHFVVVDTGGLAGDADELHAFTEKQSEAAIDEATLVVLVLDARDGLLPGDRSILDSVRRRGKPFLVAVNKTDGMDVAGALAEFARLGAASMLPISASHRRGLAPLLSAIVAELPAQTPEELAVEEAKGTRVAIVGRPNVGKSTLVNRLLGEERVIATDTPGTTRDAIHVPLERDGRKYMLIDTAGVRRKGRVEDVVEKFSIIKTLQALEEAQVAVVMIDASEGVTDQDAHVLGHVLDAGRALVIAINKWDGLDPYQRERVTAEIDRRFPYVEFAIRTTISAKHGTGMAELMKAVDRSARSAGKRMSTPELTETLEMAVQTHQPPMVGGRAAKLRYAHMGGSNPPTVVIHGTRVATLPDSYKKYLEGFIRKRFKLVGTPVKLEFRGGTNPYEGKKNVLTDKQVAKRRRMIRHIKRKGG